MRRTWLRAVGLMLPVLVTAGCQSSRIDAGPNDPGGATTRPSGRDLDREGVQAHRYMTALKDGTMRVYDAPDGQLVVDERRTFDRKGLMRHLEQQDSRRLRDGIVYFISQGRIQDEATFAAIKAFCIARNVDLYIGEGRWAQRRAAWQHLLDPGVQHEVIWIVQARP